MHQADATSEAFLRGDRRIRRTLSESENKNEGRSELGIMLDEAVSDTIGTGAATRSTRSSEISQPVSLFDSSRKNMTTGFTSVFAQGSSRFERENVKIDFSYNIVGCICRDVHCEEKVAADLVGFQQGASEQARGYSPIIFLDENGEYIPCGAENIPHHSLAEARISGCELTTNQAKGESPYRLADCPDGEAELFKVYQDDILVARSMTNKERMPEYSGVAAETSLARNYEGQNLQTLLNFYWESSFEIPWPVNQKIQIGVDLSGKAKNFIEDIVAKLTNELAAVRPQDFNDRNGNIWDAPSHAFAEVMDAFSFGRILSLEQAVTSESMELLAEQIPFFGVAVQGLPEASTEEELLSTGGLFLVAAATFGMAIGSLWRKLSSSKKETSNEVETPSSEEKKKDWIKTGVTFFLSFFLLVLEGISISVSWGKEQEQSDYSRNIASVEIIMADRFGNIMPLLYGSDGRMFFVVTKIAEVTDNTSDLSGIFYGIWGASGLVFILMIFLGRTYDLE